MLLKNLLKGLDFEIIGDINVKVTGIKSINKALGNDISLLTDRKYLKNLGRVKASVIITHKRFNKKIFKKEFRGKAVIFSGNPLFVWAKVLEKFYPGEKSSGSIAKSAIISNKSKISKSATIGENTIIEDNVEIGENTIIKHNTVIEANIKIGNNSLIYNNVSIGKDTIIGDNVIIFSGVVIGSDGFGYAQVENGLYKIPQTGRVIIKDWVEIGANSCIDRATIDETVVGKGVKIDNLVQIAHNVKIGENTVIAGLTGIAGSVKIGKNCFIGGAVGIGDHIEIGDNVKMAGKTGVTGNVESNKIIAGYPMMDIRKWRRVFGTLRKYPDIEKQIKELEKKLDKIK